MLTRDHCVAYGLLAAGQLSQFAGFRAKSSRVPSNLVQADQFTENRSSQTICPASVGPARSVTRTLGGKELGLELQAAACPLP